MRICFVLLSPTRGMHQYTAHLANCQEAAGHDVHCITTRLAPRDRYAPGVNLHTPVATRTTGFSSEGPRDLARLRPVLRAICDLHPDVAHFTGPHLWNPVLLRALERAGIATAHTLHDLQPHTGATYGRLLCLWNGWVRRRADHLIVHGRRYRQALLAQGVAPARVTATPLTHLFVGYDTEQILCGRGSSEHPASGFQNPQPVHEPWALFVGRLERYKGLDLLLEAAGYLQRGRTQIVIAGQGPELKSLVRAHRSLDNVQVRGRFVGDEEGVDLFRRCGVVVLPYIEASQSALVAAAFFFRKPVIVTRVGALPEYVVDGETGWVVPSRDVGALAAALKDAVSDRERLARMGDAGRVCYERWRCEEEVALRQMYGNLASHAEGLHGNKARAAR